MDQTDGPLNILIIEDNDSDVIMLNDILKSTELKIGNLFVATNLSATFKVVNQNKVHIILLDLTLPDSFGLNTFNYVQKGAAQTPIIILSEIADIRLASEAINKGAQDYLIKGEFNGKLLEKSILYSIERKRTAETLRLTNERYTLVSRATNDMVWDWDLVNEKIYRNAEGVVKVFGELSGEAILSFDGWTEHIHPDDREKVNETVHEVINNKQVNNFELEYRARKGDNSYIDIMDRGYVIRDDQGKALRLVGAMQNITEKKLAAEEVKRLSLIAKETTNAIIITDAQGKVTWVNNAFTKISGYTLDDMSGKKPDEILHGPETNDVMKRFIRRKLLLLEAFECDILNYSKEGKKYWVRVQCQPLTNENGKHSGFFALQTDISKEKEAVNLVRSSEEKYRNLFNNNPSSIIIWSPENFNILEINNAAITEYGYSRERFLKMLITDLNANDSKDIQSVANDMLSKVNSTHKAIWKHKTSSGSVCFMNINFQSIDYFGQKASLAIVNNITEQIRLEEKLSNERLQKQHEITAAVITAQEQEREELGKELHDNINQILATTRLYIEYAQKNADMHDELLNSAKDFILTAVNEIRTLSKTLSPPSLGEIGLIVALEELINTIRPIRKYIFDTEWCQVDEALISDGLKLTIFRIIQEQLNNIIRHAMANKVAIKIKIQNKRLLISVKDDGQGFNIADKSKGVGLKNISSRAALHNGTMQMHSEPGKGCELKVSFAL